MSHHTANTSSASRTDLHTDVTAHVAADVAYPSEPVEVVVEARSGAANTGGVDADPAVVDAVETNANGGHDTCHAHVAPAPGYAESKAAFSRRLKRIEGQVRGVERMIDEDRYCIDVLTQISAIQSGLKAVALGLLDEHMAHCVVDAARQGGDEQEQKLAEVSDAIARLMR